MDNDEREFRCERGDGGIVRVAGVLDQATVPRFMKAVAPTPGLVLDLSKVESIDTSGVAAIAVLRDRIADMGGALQLVGLAGEVRDKLALFPDARGPSEPAAVPGVIEWLGGVGYGWFETIVSLLSFAADVLWTLVSSVRFPWRQTASETVRIGVDGLPIVGMISFLVGLIIAFQAAWQLSRFGATQFVANMVGFTMVRELGPLMMGILLAGRSGSAVAAELGTMVVQEEVAAIRTMGLDPMRFLVLPRFVAFVVAGPLLAVMSMSLGILGGMTIGYFHLGFSPEEYFQQTFRLLRVGSFGNGMIKAVIYSFLVGLIACHTGLTLTGGATAVGRATTHTVVASIFSIIIADFIVTIVTLGGFF